MKGAELETWLREAKRKRRARWQVTDAIRRGHLVRLPCSSCGEPKSQGHHPDYSKPLEVVWLCGRHHREAHRVRH